MFTHLKYGVALAAFSFSIAGQAADSKLDCENTLLGCGLSITTAPAPSDLTTANCSSPVSQSYTLTNQSSSSINFTPSLVEEDFLADPTAITIDSSSTCTGTLAGSANCTLVLDFWPCVAGDLDWEFIVTPASTQRPLVQTLTATVTGSPIPYEISGGNYQTSNGNIYGLLTLSINEGRSWNYGIDLTTLGTTSPTNFDPTQDQTDFSFGTECVSQACISAGTYSDTSGNTWPLIAINGAAGNTWSYPVDSSKVGTALPSDMASDGDNHLNSSSCAANGSVCVAVGAYSDSTNDWNWPLALVSTNGGLSWTPTVDSGGPLPSDFCLPTSGCTSDFAPSAFTGIACTDSLCLAMGQYESTASNANEPLLAVSTNSGSSWTYSSSVSLPGDYAYLDSLDSVSCSPAADVCIVSGAYNNGTVNELPLLLVSTDGGSSWITAIDSSYDSSWAASSGGIMSTSCSASLCAAATSYIATNSYQYPFLAVASSDDWTDWGSAIVNSSTNLPSDAVNGSDGSFGGVSCVDPDSGSFCLASGTYDNSTGIAAMVAIYTPGGSPALNYTLDGLTGPTPYLFDPTQLISLTEASCELLNGASEAAFCTIAGTYGATDENQYPLLGKSSNGGNTWVYSIDGTPSTLPPGNWVGGAYGRLGVMFK